MGTPPQRGAGSPGHRPLSQRLTGGEDALCWVWLLVLSCRVRLFLGRGRGVCADYSVLYVSFCCSSISYQCQERGTKSLFCPPQINCHIPKLRSSPGSVSFLPAGTVVFRKLRPCLSWCGCSEERGPLALSGGRPALQPDSKLPASHPTSTSWGDGLEGNPLHR